MRIHSVLLLSARTKAPGSASRESPVLRRGPQSPAGGAAAAVVAGVVAGVVGRDAVAVASVPHLGVGVRVGRGQSQHGHHQEEELQHKKRGTL